FAYIEVLTAFNFVEATSSHDAKVALRTRRQKDVGKAYIEVLATFTLTCEAHRDSLLRIPFTLWYLELQGALRGKIIKMFCFK
ncbi:MAG: hypothetical protein KAX04_04780, partial [Methanomicrobia archaeon]|nr:hypothetical protein [Methanomicrobia archaeon]